LFNYYNEFLIPILIIKFRQYIMKHVTSHFPCVAAMALIDHVTTRHIPASHGCLATSL
jgi:hypothetical protein